MPAALDILRVFYSSGAPFLPVVDKERLLGIISREELTARASDASRAEESFETIPEDFYLAEPWGSEVFSAIGAARQSVVLSPDGQSSQIDSSRILAMIPARKREFADVMGRARDLLKREKAESAWKEFLAGLRQTASITVFDAASR